ncbi:MAG: succinyldiaminopimelate transaminase [Pseudomonadales bacterium]
MKPQLNQLQAYPFQRLAALKKATAPPADKTAIALSIGEPKHPPPAFVLESLRQNEDKYGRYPSTKGTDSLRETISAWLKIRFSLPSSSICADTQVLPVSGTREALFSIAQCLVDPSTAPLVMMPNPFYQIYEGAALLAGAQIRYMNATEENGYLPSLDSVSEEEWQRCQLIYICSPGNPSGAVCDMAYLKQLIELAHRHDFVVVSDECYSEIYRDQPPTGLLEACELTGNSDYTRCLVMNSLSKRSNLAGLRSGFVAGDAKILERYLLYRTYHGCTQSIPTQIASEAAWGDERHVVANRTAYNNKFTESQKVLDRVWPQQVPQGGFFYWAHTPIPGEQFALQLYAEENISVLPGSYLSRECDSRNPGEYRIRMALVAPQAECLAAMQRIANFVARLQ